jgi:pimeloyl-ACP methyl ester carboxylesterase
MQSKEISERHLFLRRFLKFFLIGLGFFLLLIASFIIWIYFSIFYGPDPFEISEFHPFRSVEAKNKYLAYENEMAKTWLIDSEERFVQTSFGKTFMRISGPHDAAPLILLPGGGSNSIIWRANIKALSEEYRTYALDNIYDYGRSVYTQKITDGKGLANWLYELSDSLKLGNNISLIGYSYGGWVISQYATHHPERIEKLVLIAPAFTVLPLSDEFIFQMIKSLIPVRYFKKKVMYWVWNDLSKKGEWGRRIVEDRIDYYEIAIKSFKFKQPVNPTVLSDEELIAMKIPLLFMVGENEKAYNAHHAIARLNNINPDISTVLIEGTGHDLMFTNTDTVNQLILDFLR